MDGTFLALAGLSTFLFALWGIFGKLGTERIGLQIILWAQITTLGTYMVYLFLNKELWPIKTNPWGIFWGLASGLTVAFAVITYYFLLSKHPASLVAAATSLYPAVTLVIALIFLKEQISLTQIAGIILAVFAIFLISR